ncbi:MAG: hypothetical protein ACI9C2_001489 [Gammaproteobacteria bacterium]|jgi:hypothetical protein
MIKWPLVHSLIPVLLTAPLALATTSSPTDPLQSELNASLEVTSSKLLDVIMLGEVGSSVTAMLHFDGVTLAVPLQPHSVRSASYNIQAQREDGSWYSVEPGPLQTLRGTIPVMPGSLVAASWSNGGLEARIRLESGEDWWIQPVATGAGAGLGAHVMFRDEDVRSLGGCGTSSLSNPYGGQGAPSIPAPNIRDGGDGIYAAGAGAIAELATDADYEYFQDWGSVNGVTSRIESVINTMNLQYESEVGITHQIGTQLVRTSGSQPYKSKNASKLLNSVRSEWLNNQSGVQRDVVQLFSGKAISGGTIGIAWLGAICSTNIGYGMVQSDFNGNFASATDLSAHELGHNWNAQHCSCLNNTMNPYIQSKNTFNSTFTIPTIVAFRNASTCLSDPGTPPTGGTPVSVHVESIVAGAQGVGKGKKVGTATVTILDDLGGVAAGVTVSGSFSGSFSESFTGTTGSNGTVSFTTTATAKGGVVVTFCVNSVSGGALPYDSNDDAMGCDSN